MLIIDLLLVFSASVCSKFSASVTSSAAAVVSATVCDYLCSLQDCGLHFKFWQLSVSARSGVSLNKVLWSPERQKVSLEFGSMLRHNSGSSFLSMQQDKDCAMLRLGAWTADHHVENCGNWRCSVR